MAQKWCKNLEKSKFFKISVSVSKIFKNFWECERGSNMGENYSNLSFPTLRNTWGDWISWEGRIWNSQKSPSSIPKYGSKCDLSPIHICRNHLPNPNLTIYRTKKTWKSQIFNHLPYRIAGQTRQFHHCFQVYKSIHKKLDGCDENLSDVGLNDGWEVTWGQNIVKSKCDDSPWENWSHSLNRTK